MAIRNLKPRTPATRYYSISTFDEVTKTVLSVCSPPAGKTATKEQRKATDGCSAVEAGGERVDRRRRVVVGNEMCSFAAVQVIA